MIYTCTLNPSLDYYMELNEVKLGEVNRSQNEYFVAGGKGINVSIVLNNLKIQSRALGFVGGFVKNYFIEQLQQYEYIQPCFTYIEDCTRINIKMLSAQETDLNAKGPNVKEKEKTQMLHRVQRMNAIDILVLSGSCPPNCFSMAEEMMKSCKEIGCRIVLDCKPDTMKKFLKYQPLLVKPNLKELEEMAGKKMESLDEIIAYGKSLVNEGAENCLISLGAMGALLINQDGVYRSSISKGEVVSTTGAGDSVVAGFLWNYQRSRDIQTIFRYASACGSATALSKGLATREKVEEVVKDIKVEKLEGEFQ